MAFKGLDVKNKDIEIKGVVKFLKETIGVSDVIGKSKQKNSGNVKRTSLSLRGLIPYRRRQLTFKIKKQEKADREI